MSRKENLISKLHPRKGTWKIAVRITDIWDVKKHNGRQAINMVLMDQTVIVMLFAFIVMYVVIGLFITFICNYFRVQRLVRRYGRNSSLNFNRSCIWVVSI